MLQDNIVKVNKKKLQNGIKGYGISNGKGEDGGKKDTKNRPEGVGREKCGFNFYNKNRRVYWSLKGQGIGGLILGIF